MTEAIALSPEQVVEFEIEFVCNAIHAAGDKRSEKDAWRAFDKIDPKMLSPRPLRLIYSTVRDMFVDGAAIDPATLQATIENLEDDDDGDSAELYADTIGPNIFTSAQLEDRTAVVIREWRRRGFNDLCDKAVVALKGTHGRDGGERLANTLSMRLIELYAGSGSMNGSQYPTSQEVVETLRQRATNPDETGVRFPWRKLDDLCGPIVPGELLAITAYSNQGKSVFAANLFWSYVRSGVPCIAFPTEMMYQWVERGMATVANVSQWRAEKRKWKGEEGEYELGKYLETLKDVEDRENWRIVARPNISPAEIVMAVRILRKQWPGQRVMFFVDHMHRLDYGGDKADEKIGEATRMMKNLAHEDGHLIPILLYQPKKPEGGKEPYGPIGGHRIRGHSEVWNEIDIHLSPWRAVVETVNDIENKTSWGSVRAKLNREGLPIIRKPTQLMEGRKWDDEHFHVKIDKRRVGGIGPNVILQFTKPSGKIWERASPEDEERSLDL